MQDEIIKNEIKLNQIICGKSEEKLKIFPDNFFDGIVTDPPYELNFMGKAWDASGIAYNVELWKEVLRVCKPGSFLLCFGGTRTSHRVACAIEDAGFLIKDNIDWIYGEGFPKSCNISKQLDKESGVEREKVWVESSHGAAGGNLSPRPWTEKAEQDGGHLVDGETPLTDDAKLWEGYGTGLKPAHEPIIVAMKPLEKGLTYAQNAKKWNVAGLNIDGCRIGTDIMVEGRAGSSRSGCYQWNAGEKKSGEKVENPQHHQGRWPSNIILSHSPDCICIGTKNEQEVYACIPDCPIRIMDSQSGQLSQCGGEKKTTHSDGIFGIGTPGKIYREQFRGASRFFYCAKAKRSEKDAGLRGFVECAKCERFDSKTHKIKGVKEDCVRNVHPTVKPLDLIKYLLTLIKMPSTEENKQVILDPFCGSGTMLVAAEQLGINYIGIDMDSDNCLTSIGRIGA